VVLNGAFYKHIRIAAGVSASDMARSCQVSTGYISMMEEGDRCFLEKYALTYLKVVERYLGSGER
jgi:transcriptional regulator with XRE-family HTH domain